MVEIRKDYFTDKLSVVTSDRGARSQFRPYSDHGAKCPFCPGNEEMTPQADLVVVKMGDTLVKQTDSEGDPVRGWIVRVFPDKFPIVTPNAAPSYGEAPALQRAGDRVPLHPGRDAEARPDLPEAGHRPVDQRPGDPPGQDALALRPARRGLRGHLHQPGQGRRRRSSTIRTSSSSRSRGCLRSSSRRPSPSRTRSTSWGYAPCARSWPPRPGGPGRSSRRSTSSRSPLGLGPRLRVLDLPEAAPDQHAEALAEGAHGPRPHTPRDPGRDVEGPRRLRASTWSSTTRRRRRPPSRSTGTSRSIRGSRTGPGWSSGPGSS